MSPVVTVRFNSQHPRKIIRGVGGRRSRKGPGGATHCPVTPVGIMALSLIKVQVAALARLTQARHVQRGHLEGILGRTDFQSGTGQATPPWGSLSVKSCASTKCPTEDATREPLPSLMPGTPRPQPLQGFSEVDEGAGVQAMGLGVPAQLFGVLEHSYAYCKFHWQFLKDQSWLLMCIVWR